MERTRRRLYEEQVTLHPGNSVQGEGVADVTGQGFVGRIDRSGSGGEKGSPFKRAPLESSGDGGSQSDIRALKGTIHIQDSIALSMGLSLVPVPFVGSLSLSLIQFRMVRRLAALYEVPFDAEFTRAFLSSLFGGAAGVVAGRSVSTLLTGVYPPLGVLFGGASVAAFGGASTYAVGELFHSHFRSGGTFFDIEKRRFRERFQIIFAERLPQSS